MRNRAGEKYPRRRVDRADARLHVCWGIPSRSQFVEDRRSGNGDVDARILQGDGAARNETGSGIASSTGLHVEAAALEFTVLLGRLSDTGRMEVNRVGSFYD